MKDSKYQGQKAISYARASMGKGRGQEDSTDRQVAETQEYCQRYGLELDESYTLVDEGVSAFRQVKGKDGKMIAKNLHESALAKFTDEVKKGAFPNGVHLIVEKLDRMYRDDPERAMEHMLKLKRHGVTIHTTMDNQIFDPNEKEKQTQLLISVIKLCASHEFSKALSQRQLKSRERRLNKMKSGELYYEPMGCQKSWIQKVVDPETNKTKPFVSDQHRILIKQVFKMYAEDGMSGREISRRFNTEGIKTPYGHGWSPSTVIELIKDRAVIGWVKITKDEEFYYPEVEVISKELFQLANERLANRGIKKGRKSEDHHIFDGLMVCGYCQSVKRKLKGINKYVDTTLRYTKDTKYNPIEAFKAKRPYTSYRCSRGMEDSRNCNANRIDYYDFYDSFFAFVKELDFSSLLDDDESENLNYQSRLLELKNEIDQKKKEKQKFEKLLDRFEDDEDMFNEYADKIKDANSELKSIQIEYESEKSKFESRRLAKSEVKQNQKEIKELLEKAHNHNEWLAYETLRIDLDDKKYSTGKYAGKNISKSDQKKYDDIWSISLMDDQINQLRKGNQTKEKRNKIEELIEKIDTIRYKYFSDEIEKDQEALEMKMKLNALLSRYIKKIEYFPFGLMNIKKTKPYENRDKGELSCSDQIKKRLNEYLEKHNLITVSEPDLKPKKWTGATIKKVLGISSNSTLKNWLAEGMPDPRVEGVSIKDTILWKKKRDMVNHSVSNSKANRHLNQIYKQFRGFKIEFSDICKPDTIKYVLPYYKNPKAGICYSINRKNQQATWESNFGDVEIKMNRMMEKGKPVKSKKPTIYVCDDKILRIQVFNLIAHIGMYENRTMWTVTMYNEKQKKFASIIKKANAMKDSQEKLDYMRLHLETVEEWFIVQDNKRSSSDFKNTSMDDRVDSRVELNDAMKFQIKVSDLEKQFEK